MFRPWNIFGYSRISPGCNTNMLCGRSFSLTSIEKFDFNFTRLNKSCCSCNIITLILLQVPFVNPIESLNVSISLHFQGTPIETRNTSRDTVSVLRSITNMFRHISRIPHDFLGNTTNIDLPVNSNDTKERPTQVPPRRPLFSMMATLAPYMALARRPNPSPPDPPPMTIAS